MHLAASLGTATSFQGASHGGMSSPAVAKALQFHFCNVQLQPCHKEPTTLARSTKSASRPKLRNNAIRSWPGRPKWEQTAGTRARAAYFRRFTPSMTETAVPALVCLGSPRARAKGLTTATSTTQTHTHAHTQTHTQLYICTEGKSHDTPL